MDIAKILEDAIQSLKEAVSILDEVEPIEQEEMLEWKEYQELIEQEIEKLKELENGIFTH